MGGEVDHLCFALNFSKEKKSGKKTFNLASIIFLEI